MDAIKGVKARAGSLGEAVVEKEDVGSGQPSGFVALLESITLSAADALPDHARTLAERTAGIYRHVVETSPDAITITDLEMRVLLCNERAAKLHGYDCPDEMLGRRVLGAVAPEDRERALDNVRRTLEEGSVRDVEYRLLRRDGTRFPVELSASVIKDGQGRPQAFVGVVRDISERKLAEANLLEEKALSESLLDSLPGVFYIFDDQGRFLRWNKNAEEITGYSAEEIAEMSPLDFIAPGDQALIAERIRDAFTSGRATGEATLVSKEGAETPYFFTGLRVQIENHAYVAGMGLDVSEWKQTEQALRESEERYRALYQDNPTMYFTVSAEGVVLSVNEFGAQQLGYAVSELVGRPVLDVFFDEDKEGVAGQFQACLKAPGEVRSWEFRKVRKNGDVIWVKEAARAAQDIDGSTIVLIVCEDITERRRMEEELQKAREELEGKIERRMQPAGAYGLTFRELTVLHLISAGSSDKEIAVALGISPLTVSKHVANILGKMHASSRSEASARAVRENLVD